MNDTEYTVSTPSILVLEAIADAEGVSPANLKPPLDDVIDTAALDQLFKPNATDDSARDGRVSFRYRGYDVTISSDGTVELG